MTRFPFLSLWLLTIAGCGFPDGGDPEPRYPEFPLTPTPGILWNDEVIIGDRGWVGEIAVDTSGAYVLALLSDQLTLRKYTATGRVVWERAIEYSMHAVAGDGRGVYVGGGTRAALEGPNRGFGDAFVRRYDADGTVTCTMQWGSDDGDAVSGLAVHEGSYPGIYASWRRGERVFMARLRPCYLPAHIDFMEEVVRDLMVAGALEQGVGQTLVAGLDAAAERLEGDDPAGAADLMAGVVDQTDELVRNGTLSTAQAAPLIYNARVLIESLTQG